MNIKFLFIVFMTCAVSHIESAAQKRSLPQGWTLGECEPNYPGGPICAIPPRKDNKLKQEKTNTTKQAKRKKQ